jgi:hypothetical protein
VTRYLCENIAQCPKEIFFFLGSLGHIAGP